MTTHVEQAYIRASIPNDEVSQKILDMIDAFDNGGSGTGSVTSVNGEQGVVVLTTADIPEDPSKKYYTEALVDANVNPKIAAVESHITNEATARSNADDLLQDNIDSEVSRASSAESIIQANLTTHINKTSGAHAASAISNIPSGNLSSTTVQAALNELQSDIDTIGSTTTEVNNLITLSGVPANSTDLGTFTGTTIPDNTNVKIALQSLEAAVEAIPIAPVLSVNTKTGNIVLTTSDINEGTNLYYTNTRVNSNVDPKIANLQSQVDLKEDKANKGISNGYASLDSNSIVTDSQIPAYAKQVSYYEIHMFTQYTGAVETGSITQPYKTLAGAIAAAIAIGTANAVVFMHNSTTENIVINNFPNGLLICAFGTGTHDSQSVKLNGNITLSGTTTRIKIKDINIAYPGGTQPDLIINGSAGRHYFSNTGFQGGGGIQFTGSWARWHEFTECTIAGNVDLGGTPVSGALMSSWRTRGSTFTVNHTNATLNLVNSEAEGMITHSNGNLIIEGGSGFSGDILSTSNTGMMKLLNFSLNNGGNSFVHINKSGSCPYIISNVWRDEANDVLTGTRVIFGATSTDQKYLPAAPLQWLVVPGSTKEALDSLSDKVALINTSKYVKTVAIIDWGAAISGEYILTIPFSTHSKPNPIVSCMEQNGTDFEVIYPSITINGDDVIIKVLETPDTRFIGKIYIA